MTSQNVNPGASLLLIYPRVCVCVCVCVCMRNIWPISARTLLFRIQTSRKFCSHSKIPIRCLWTAFCVPLSFIFYEKQWFTMQIVTLRRSRFAGLWQINNSRNPFSRRGWMVRGQRENVVGPTELNRAPSIGIWWRRHGPFCWSPLTCRMRENLYTSQW